MTIGLTQLRNSLDYAATTASSTTGGGKRGGSGGGSGGGGDGDGGGVGGDGGLPSSASTPNLEVGSRHLVDPLTARTDANSRRTRRGGAGGLGQLLFKQKAAAGGRGSGSAGEDVLLPMSTHTAAQTKADKLAEAQRESQRVCACACHGQGECGHSAMLRTHHREAPLFDTVCV